MAHGDLPTARSAHSSDEREKLRQIVVQRGLGGLANDTKWNELIASIRDRADWRPSYRYKCLDGLPSEWDVEWFYHLPFPMLSVEWIDVTYLQSVGEHRLPPPITVVDHSKWLIPLLQRIGLDDHVGTNMIRVFGYSPRSLDLFDQ